MKGVVDRYRRGIMSPCNRCKKLVSFTEHRCKGYPYRDGIPPKVYSGKMEKCEYFEEKEEWKNAASK